MTKKTLGIEKYFTRGIKDVYKETNWKKLDANIKDDKGKLLFVQKNVEAPESYSQLAVDIIASRYFYGDKTSFERESSVRQLVGRVAETIAGYALNDKYFKKEDNEIFEQELAKLCLDQRMAFNSPVWFNVGTDRYSSRKTNDIKDAYILKNGKVIKVPRGQDHLYPQTSACFIQSVEDTMESIMELAKVEALLFRYGSGTGTDLSTLRSSRERISGGGKPSGPLAYEAFYDRVAGIVKSGGKTRRAAKMNSLRIDHPDIKEFIEAKAKEEHKFNVLVAGGIDEKEARDTVAFQNANLSVRVTDNFMHAVENNEEWQTIPVHSKELKDIMPKYKAKDLMRMIAEGTWICGDPGLQYHDTINRWHTCPNSAPINASNPCSEYMSVDNSSCNLASQNLMCYINPDGSFNTKDFGKAIRILTIAQDLFYDNSSFPTREIAKNSHLFRPLGMGYANLGALLMFLGMPYDSDEGRNTAAAITALLTGKVYETSSEMAEKLGPFSEFEKNKEPMMNVIQMHRKALERIDKSMLPKGLEHVLDEAKKTWDNVVKQGEKYGFRNSQASVLAPTGTIGFMMDCATTGIEPDGGLVKYKLLAEGGVLKIPNWTVEPSLKRLGYSEHDIGSITEYIRENDTIEGSILKTEHLPIFDCSLKAEKGTRVISPMGHVKMMVAVQPFISGAISKTVNMDKKTTVEEIEQVYKDAWKMGLKAVAIYRDESKQFQPLSASKKSSDGKKLETKLIEESLSHRRKLSGTRNSITHKFNIAHHEGYLTVGLYEDGTPGELFVTMSKEGSTVGGLMDTVGVLTSFALQHGVPMKDLAEKMRGNRFEPSGIVFEGGEDIHTATSITDYLFNWMGRKFVKGYDGKKDQPNFSYDPKEDETKSYDHNSNDNDVSNIAIEHKISKDNQGGFCIKCGTQMIKMGHCEERCPTKGCGYVDYIGCGK